MSSLASIKSKNWEGVEVPSLDVSFDDLQNRMEKFRLQFDQYLTTNKEKIIESRNEFNVTMTKNKETDKFLLSEIESLNQKNVEIAKSRAKEQQELEETKSAIGDYSLKREQMTETQRNLEKQISELRQSIAKIKEDQVKVKQTIAQESSKDIPELLVWETTLGLTIEGISEDVIKFTFINVDPSKVDREFSCVLDLSARDYKVIDTNPKLDEKVIEEIVQGLNSSRQPNIFLRDIRNAFKKIL